MKLDLKNDKIFLFGDDNYLSIINLEKLLTAQLEENKIIFIFENKETRLFYDSYENAKEAFLGLFKYWTFGEVK